VGKGVAGEGGVWLAGKIVSRSDITSYPGEVQSGGPEVYGAVVKAELLWVGLLAGGIWQFR